MKELGKDPTEEELRGKILELFDRQQEQFPNPNLLLNL